MMIQRKILFVALVSLLPILLYNFTAFALDLDDLSAFECDGEIVNIGDTKDVVSEKCGQPTSAKTVKMGWEEVWIYDFGSNRLVHYLTFSGERLERIQIGGYGSGDVQDRGTSINK